MHPPRPTALRRLPPTSAAPSRPRPIIEIAPARDPRTRLPDPDPLLRNLAVGVLEVLSGARSSEQFARWLSEESYRHLTMRANLAARSRSARGGLPPARPAIEVLSSRSQSPVPGVVEGVVVLRTPARSRAVTMRLEASGGRWRATALALL